jgi:HK97 family phage major capsid protein
VTRVCAGAPRVTLHRPKAGGPWKAHELFGPGGDDGFDSLENFLAPVVANMYDPRLTIGMASQEGSGPAGGYTVPTQYSQRWLDTVIEESAILGRCSVLPMTSNTMHVPGFDASDHSGSAMLGGITGGWVGESGDISYETPKFRKVELKANKLAALTAASSEIVADGIGFAQQLEAGLVRGMQWLVDDALISGTGAGQPRGLLNDVAKITVSKATEQDADSIVYENIVDMLNRLHPICWDRAVWLCNPGCVSQLLQIAIPVGLGGQWVQVLKENTGKFTILGRQVVFSEKCSALGDEGDIILADLSQYAVGLRQEITIERSSHVRFANDEVVFRAIARLDGQGLWGSAFTPKNGVTQSWCVTLQARA